jgi:hypothetical protein
MTIEQTVEIPANRQITFDVPPQIPTGTTARLELIWFPQRNKADEFNTTLEKIWELCEDVPISVDSFLEERRQDNDIEEERYRKSFGDNN